MKKILVEYRRGDAFTGAVYEEQLENAGLRMWVEIRLKFKDKDDEVIIEDIKEKDQEFAEMRLQQMMEDKFRELHGRNKRTHPNLTS
jgi:hypothetical protein